MPFESINPATEEQLQTYPGLSADSALEAARRTFEAFGSWRDVPLSERRRFFIKIASLLKEGKERFSKLITAEMGKPIRQAEAEIDKCVWGCEFYAEQASSYIKEERITTDAGKSYLRYDPLGVVMAIMPWNFPFWQVFRCAAPAMMAGNAVLLKHAPNVPGCALAIESLFREAGFPDRTFQSLFVETDVAAELIESPWVQAVSLTGSDRAGAQVAAVAGRALKKTVLELGGSDPFIVLEDADLGKCLPVAVRSRMLNAGQSCIAAKRMIVVERVAEKFQKGLTEAVQAQKVGDPLDPATDIGPLARRDLLENLMRQVEGSMKKGAKLLTGGRRLPGKGFFYEPTLLKEVHPGMPAFDEETFGPVASIIVVKNEEEAILLANQTAYGLGASLWTQDIKKAEAVAARIEAGSVFINGMVKSDPRLPFGGVKRSGYGRELSAHGMREFTNIKTVWVA